MFHEARHEIDNAIREEGINKLVGAFPAQLGTVVDELDKEHRESCWSMLIINFRVYRTLAEKQVMALCNL